MSVERMLDVQLALADQRFFENFRPNLTLSLQSQLIVGHQGTRPSNAHRAQAGQVPQQVIDLSIASSLQHNSNQIRGNYNAQDGLKNSFASQKPTPQQIMEIHSFIKSEENFNALTSHEGMKVGDKLVFLPEGQDCNLFTDFDFTKPTEWCLLKQGANKYDLILADTAEQLISHGNRHPFDQRILNTDDFVRGQKLLKCFKQDELATSNL